MKIRTQFMINMFLFGVILLVIAVSLIVTNQQVNRLLHQDEIAHNIERAALELSYLSNDFLLHRESQQRARWESKFASLSEDVNRLQPNHPDQQVLVDQMKENLERLDSVFQNIVQTMESISDTHNAVNEMAFMQVSWSRIEVQNQGMIFDSSLLSHEILDQIDQLKHRYTVLIFVLVGLFGVYLFSNYWLIYRRTLRSLAVLQAGTQIIGSGNLAYTIDDRRSDEIGELSRALNQMTTNLREITASKADLEREISERKQVEEALRQSQADLAEYAGKLKRSNQELEQFAFIASHDLQEPLRKIRGFGSRLVKHLDGELEQEPREFLMRMQNAAERMQTMIDDLLELSRVSTRSELFERVDLYEAAEEVISDLDSRILAAKGRVICEPLPVVEGDPRQMRQLLQNLIANALKYHKPDQPPVVKVSGTVDPCPPGGVQTVTLLVEDNGIGFDEAYLERIFQPFQRLHGRSEYEGTGMGLSICRKIVERHQGFITACSQPGEGSKFIVTLPVKQQK